MAIFIARELLAEQIRDKITKDLEGRDLDGEDAETFAAYVSYDNVVEILEEMIEGDAVLDDPAEHRWFRDKLTEQRNLEMKIEQLAARAKHGTEHGK